MCANRCRAELSFRVESEHASEEVFLKMMILVRHVTAAAGQQGDVDSRLTTENLEYRRKDIVIFAVRGCIIKRITKMKEHGMMTVILEINHKSCY